MGGAIMACGARAGPPWLNSEKSEGAGVTIGGIGDSGAGDTIGGRGAGVTIGGIGGRGSLLMGGIGSGDTLGATGGGEG